jgi:DNA-directed RNA polymerase I subunit RPA43
MSVQVDGGKAVRVKNSESLSTPKKRKHDADSKESSKKKKKQRIEPAESTTAVTTTAEDGLTKKKKKKSRENQNEVVENGGDEATSATPADIELPDAAEEEQEDITEAATATNDDAHAGGDVEEVIEDLLESADPTCFYSTRISLYVSIPAVSLETAGPSVLATHLAPLILTYFPPAKGIVLAFSDPVLSAKPGSAINIPLISPQTGVVQSEGDVLARTADELGVSWVWLTVTLLVFRPERGDELYGWTNVTSEGFVGLVSYNYFQTAVGSSRIPEDWKWNGPTRQDLKRNKKKGRKGKLGGDDQKIQGQAETGDEQPYTPYAQVGNDLGIFTDGNGIKIDGTLQFRVVDTEVVPAHDRHKWSLQIDGTLLDDEAEKRALSEDRAKFERSQQRSQSQTPGDGMIDTLMSGARGLSREGSAVSRISRTVAT